VAALLGLLAALRSHDGGRAAKRLRDRTGQAPAVLWPSVLAFVALAVMAWAAWARPPPFSVPTLGGFNFEGGKNISPEFTALYVGLSIYTAAFIAEIVRGGILAVPKGQNEARWR
jgi:general L-amino acid transport system permease protein